MNVGVALGGGGGRGIAHLLALETIDACGIKPTAVAGTSMGSIIGALYASGLSGLSGREIRERLERHMIKRGDGLKEVYRKKDTLLKWLKVFRPSVGSTGLIKVDGFMQFLLDELRVDTFEDLVDNVVMAMLKQRPPTIYIRPELTGIRVLEFDKTELVLERAQPAMDELRTKLQARVATQP